MKVLINSRLLPGLILLAGLLFLASLSCGMAQPSLSGFLELDKRFVTGGDSTYIDNFYNRFRLEMNAPVDSQLYLFSSLDLRFYDFPNPQSLSDLESLESEFPYELSMWEAFIDVYGLIFDDFDIRVGKQRIAWGRADKFNPTDNLNPNDFSDLVNFTEMAPSWAFKGTWYFENSRLTGVWLPGITPVLLPPNGANLFLGDLDSFNDKLRFPDHIPKNSMFAFRWDGSLDKWDYSISYFNGYDDLPIPTHLTLRSPPISPVIRMEFPTMQVVGADLATDLSGIGVWAEAGLFIPKEVTFVTELNGTASEETQLGRDPYLKFTIGGDYTFSNGVYLNAQLMHGFDTERGGGDLNDYYVVRLEKEYFEDDVLIVLNNILEVNDWKQIGYGVEPELTYQAIDNFEAGLDAFLIWGEEETLLNSWEELDQVFVRFCVDF